jgi:hypothetical protein
MGAGPYEWYAEAIPARAYGNGPPSSPVTNRYPSAASRFWEEHSIPPMLDA